MIVYALMSIVFMRWAARPRTQRLCVFLGDWAFDNFIKHLPQAVRLGKAPVEELESTVAESAEVEHQPEVGSHTISVFDRTGQLLPNRFRVFRRHGAQRLDFREQQLLEMDQLPLLLEGERPSDVKHTLKIGDRRPHRHGAHVPFLGRQNLVLRHGLAARLGVEASRDDRQDGG
jgi:hypothetical protein